MMKNGKMCFWHRERPTGGIQMLDDILVCFQKPVLVVCGTLTFARPIPYTFGTA